MRADETDPGSFNVRSEHDGQAVYLQVSGELDIATSPVLEKWLTTVQSNGNTKVVVDLEHLTFMDTSGIHAFLRAAERSRHSGRDFAITNAPRVARKILEITKTTHLLDMKTELTL